jgi:Tol biopolymer transport system component
MLMLGPYDSRILALGWGAAISPMRDQIAFLTSSNAQMIDADTSSKRRITSVPFYILSIPPFVREETGWSKVAWSPQGDRFWFSTVLDEEFNSNYYLVDVRDGTRRRVLKNTSIDILAWR